jgi:AcrR family transcriptional regulator
MASRRRLGSRAQGVERADSSRGSLGALYEKLSPGPGRTEFAVSSHQRARLHGAMVEIAGTGGYEMVTVRKLARLAGVSTGSFYKHFDDKDECLLSTYESLVRRTARRMVEAEKGGRDWRERLRRGLRTLANDIAAEPKAARLVLVEAFALGPPAFERMSRAETIFESVVAASFSKAPQEVTPPPLVARGILAGATWVARARILGAGAAEVPAMVDELTEWALSYAGDAGAALERGRV